MIKDLPQIIEGCKTQDRLMQKSLYQHCYKDMMKLCDRYTRDPHLSGSIYNDAMIKVFKSISNYEEEGKLMAWVKRIVVNTCIDHLRKKQPLEFTALNGEIQPGSTIENSVFNKMSNTEIKTMISQLPRNACVVFNLFVYEEYNHSEIATLLNIPAGTSRYYLSEARRILKELVSKDFHSLNKA